MDVLFLVFSLLAVSVFIFVMMLWTHSKSKALIAGWAKKNTFEILKCEHRLFKRGPFTWTTSRSQTVYLLSLKDEKGKQRSCFIRCGGWWMGLFTKKTEVHWLD